MSDDTNNPHPNWDEARHTFHGLCEARGLVPKYKTHRFHNGTYAAKVSVNGQTTTTEEGRRYSSQSKSKNAVAALALAQIFCLTSIQTIPTQQTPPGFMLQNQNVQSESSDLVPFGGNSSNQPFASNPTGDNSAEIPGGQIVRSTGLLPDEFFGLADHSREVFVIHIETSKGIGGLKLPAPYDQLRERVECLVRRLSSLFTEEGLTMAHASFAELDAYMRMELQIRFSKIEIEDSGNVLGCGSRPFNPPQFLEALVLPQHLGPFATLELKTYYAHSHRRELLETLSVFGEGAIQAWPLVASVIVSKITRTFGQS